MKQLIPAGRFCARASDEVVAAFGEQARALVEDWLERFGSYEIVRVLGTGGMGTVYEAVQQSPRRHVALKTMRRGLRSDAARRRFEYEAQVLGELRHPGIAQVYEAAVYDDPDVPTRVPYFAMEHVAGARPITEYASTHELDIESRLRLFGAVCDGVHHGHAQHRLRRAHDRPRRRRRDGDWRKRSCLYAHGALRVCQHEGPLRKAR